MKKIVILASIMVAFSVVSFAQQLNATPANDNVKQEDQRQKNRVPALSKATTTTVVTPPAQLSYSGNTTLSNVNKQQPAASKAPGIPLHKQVSPAGHFAPNTVSPAAK
jgi:hypothetical protein